MRNKIIYISGPYRADTESEVFDNIMNAKDVAKQIWRLGAIALCPHLNTMFFGGILPDEEWLIGDLILLSRCDAVYMMAGWKTSEGSIREYHHAEELKIPIFELPSKLVDFIKTEKKKLKIT